MFNTVVGRSGGLFYTSERRRRTKNVRELSCCCRQQHTQFSYDTPEYHDKVAQHERDPPCVQWGPQGNIARMSLPDHEDGSSGVLERADGM